VLEKNWREEENERNCCCVAKKPILNYLFEGESSSGSNREKVSSCRLESEMSSETEGGLG